MAQNWRKEFLEKYCGKPWVYKIEWWFWSCPVIYCLGKSRNGPWVVEDALAAASPDDALWVVVERVRGKPHEFCVELIEDVWVLVCYAFQDQQWHKYILGPCTEFEDLLEYYKITPRKVEPEPKTAEDKLRKYAQLGYEFQILKRWNKHYLYARKWMPEEKKRSSRYIGPWTDNLKKLAEEMGVKPTYYPQDRTSKGFT